MNTINVQLQEAISNSALTKVDELRFTLRASDSSFPAGSIRWKANTIATFTIRIVTSSGETSQTLTLSQNSWSNLSFANQNCDVFVSPKSKISEFQLTDDVSERVSIDWSTFIYSGVRKLITYRSLIDTSMLPLLTQITQWDSRYNKQAIDFKPYTCMTALTYLNLQGLTMYGNTEGIGALTNIQQLRLLSIANLECHLSDFAQCSTLNSLICSDNSKIYGTLEDLLPLAGTLSSLHLNGAINVCGNLKSLKNLSNLTECSFGSTGVSGKITDLNGMKTSGTLSLRVSAHIENDINSVALVNNNTYTITFSGGVVTGIN